MDANGIVHANTKRDVRRLVVAVAICRRRRIIPRFLVGACIQCMSLLVREGRGSWRGGWVHTKMSHEL